MILEWPAIAAMATVFGFAISFATFWLTFGSRLGKAEADAKAAKEEAKDAQDKLAIMGATFSLFREQVAREYIHREVMREVEERLTAAIDRLGDRLDRVLEHAGRPGKPS